MNDSTAWIRLRLSAAVPLLLAILWCFFLYRNGYYRHWPVLLAGTVGLFAVFRLYRGEYLSLALSKFDVGALALLFLVHFIFQFSYLFQSLGGDELYHAERANFILLWLRDWVSSWQTKTPDYFRESAWRLFDLRYLAVYDVWRLVSAIFLVGLFPFYFLSRRFPILRAGFLWLGLGVIMAIGWTRSVSDFHPPFRLFPLFVSNLLFGYNDFAFRIPSLIVSTLLGFYVYLSLRRADPNLPRAWSLLCAGLVGFIPVVFYVSTQVENSVFGFAVWVIAYLEGGRFLKDQNESSLLWMGILVGLGSVTRHTTLLLWFWIFALFVFSRHRFNFKLALRVFLPGLLVIPYLLSVKQGGHVALPHRSFFESAVFALQSGIGLTAMLNTTTVTWAFFLLLAGIFLVRKTEGRDWFPFLMFVPVFFLFQHLQDVLLGVGRYQAEYVAPFIVLILFQVALKTLPPWRTAVAAVFVLLAATSWEANKNAASDINFRLWGQMKISSSANFAWNPTLAYLKREESQGNFAILGGQPFYGEALLWLNVFSFSESKRWRNIWEMTAPLFDRNPTLLAVATFFKEQGIQYLVVETGTRREHQHRNPGMEGLIHTLQHSDEAGMAGFKRVRSFSDDLGGTLEIYQLHGVAKN